MSPPSSAPHIFEHAQIMREAALRVNTFLNAFYLFPL